MNSVADAFKAIDRRDFLPEEVRGNAGDDRPLPIGYGQTNSQPYTVRLMLEWLDAEEGQTVLDVGSGSGWTTALIAKIVGKSGRVYAVEIVPELVEYGRNNCENAGITNAKFFEAGKVLGLPKYAPYDRILVSASTGHMPEALVHQLGAPGKLIVPIGETIYEIIKDDSGNISQLEHYGFVFVPLLSPESYS